jgi:hypothetical protein
VVVDVIADVDVIVDVIVDGDGDGGRTTRDCSAFTMFAHNPSATIDR